MRIGGVLYKGYCGRKLVRDGEAADRSVRRGSLMVFILQVLFCQSRLFSLLSLGFLLLSVDSSSFIPKMPWV